MAEFEGVQVSTVTAPWGRFGSMVRVGFRAPTGPAGHAGPGWAR